MEVIDGQHRIMAAAKLNVDVYYEIVPGLVLEDVMSINTHSKNWHVNDFIHAYIRLGFKSYEVLESFMRRHGVSASLGASLLSGYQSFVSGYSTSGSASTLSSVKDGSFKVVSEEYADKVLMALTQVDAFTDFDTRQERTFCKAFVMLLANPDFELSKFIVKLEGSGLRIQRKATLNYYLLQLEEIYNWNAKKRTELYASSMEQAEKVKQTVSKNRRAEFTA
jgi:hypothetical protein